MNPIADDILKHYGMPKRSGRYPWGSGSNPYQRTGDFLSRISELKSGGMTDTEIAKSLGLTSTEYRIQRSLARSERRSTLVAQAEALRDKGYSLNDIAKKMGYKNDSSVRSLLDEKAKTRMNQAWDTAEFLKSQVNEKGMIDIGTGVERYDSLGVSPEMMKQALWILEKEGYPTYGGRVPQQTNPGKHTTLKVLCPPGTDHKDIYQFDKIKTIEDYASIDGGKTFQKLQYPKSLDSKRIQIRYAEEGGVEKDGVVELRRGVDDISLGASRYAQVRILVDNDKYIKGMALYSDKMPEGVDVIFNTNKPKGTSLGKVLKEIKTDPDNPFGSLLKNPGGQRTYIDKNGKEQLSVINKTREEGDWNAWSDNLASQFLAKQSMHLINKQLGLAEADKQSELDDILIVDNPTVKKKLLQTFSEDCDSAAVHLQAAALPRQKHQVILPLTTMKDNEIYAPNYKNGERVALVRYPHGGTFEIPLLTVNNNQPEGKRVLSQSKDAVGINSKVADRLSGADFDGDTVLVIPTNDRVKISSQPSLDGLKGFDPKLEYGAVSSKTGSDGNTKYYNGAGEEYKIMSRTQLEMGKISNLITDMTLKGAKTDELSRAVRHSMVVIDAEKHKLNYTQSAIDNQISSLKKKYQGGANKGASTLLSRSKSEVRVDKSVGTPKINQKGKSWYDPTQPEGSLIYNRPPKEYEVYRKVLDPVTGETMRDPITGKIIKEPTGKFKPVQEKVTRMEDTPDAFTLVSDANTQQEEAYATYANKMKSLANQARKTLVTTGKIAYSSTAKETYKTEVDSLMSKLNDAIKNAPRERKAQLIATSVVNAKKADNDQLTSKDIRKLSQQELTKARGLVGAARIPIDITPKEWEAIQAGSISETQLVKILNNTDIDIVREYATPKSVNTLSDAKVNKIKSMESSGYNASEIAEAIGVSASTVNKYRK